MIRPFPPARMPCRELLWTQQLRTTPWSPIILIPSPRAPAISNPSTVTHSHPVSLSKPRPVAPVSTAPHFFSDLTTVGRSGVPWWPFCISTPA